MPTLDIDQFDESPSIGDKVKVMGKVKSIDRDTGEVDVSYDDVSIVKEGSKKKKRKNYDDEDNVYMNENMPPEMNPNSQSLDQALSQAFPNTQ